MKEFISAGEAQQLDKMGPRERMTVLASHDFGNWVGANYPKRSTEEKLRLKRAYVAGFMNGMDRTGRALLKPTVWQKVKGAFKFIGALSLPQRGA